jgi:hypothetical protein
VAAARRLNRLEREQDACGVDRAFDDELTMAEFRVSGEAFAGTVVQRDPLRVDASGKRRVLRPHITVRTSDPVRLELGAVVRSSARSSQDARIVAVSPSGSSIDVTLELAKGMGSKLTPAEGSVPELSELLCYSTLSPDAGRSPAFPTREETPWTHGGPPADYVPTTEDAVEVWS